MGAASKRLDDALAELTYYSKLKAPGDIALLDPSKLLVNLPTVWTQEEKDNLVRGGSVWLGVAALGRTAALRRLAVKYYSTTAEVERCDEELNLLKWERAKTLQYYKHMVTILEEGAVRQEAEAWELIEAGAAGVELDVGAPQPGSVAAVESGVAHAASFVLLNRYVDFYKAQHAAATRAFAGQPEFDRVIAT